MTRGRSQEEKVAEKLSSLVSDLRLDLDEVGVYLARQTPSTGLRRIKIITESAEYERNETNEPRFELY